MEAEGEIGALLEHPAKPAVGFHLAHMPLGPRLLGRCAGPDLNGSEVDSLLPCFDTNVIHLCFFRNS